MKHYASRHFTERFRVMGDHAEGAFELWAEQNNLEIERFGFNRPSFRQFKNMPIRLRFAPDYLIETPEYKFVECKGTGGRTLKLKCASHNALEFWHEVAPVDYFVWDSNKSRYAIIPYTRMDELALLSPVREFPNDNNPYYEIKCNAFSWTELHGETKDDY